MTEKMAVPFQIALWGGLILKVCVHKMTVTSLGQAVGMGLLPMTMYLKRGNDAAFTSPPRKKRIIGYRAVFVYF